MTSTILQLRGVYGFSDIAAIIAFIILVNWLYSLYGVKSFQADPLPHMDPFGWLTGSYNHQKPFPTSRPRSVSNKSTALQLSQNPTKSQVAEFVKNGKVDLRASFQEVARRASEIGCEYFECSFERFKSLSTECGKIKKSSVREAITILQGEMHGYYKNARRVYYVTNVKGIRLCC